MALAGASKLQNRRFLIELVGDRDYFSSLMLDK